MGFIYVPDLTIYKHYKGGYYQLLFEAILESTQEIMMVYKELKSSKEAKTWVRPKSEWREEVINDYGEKVPRFSLVSKSEYKRLDSMISEKEIK